VANARKITIELDADEVAKAREAMGSSADEPDAAIVERVLNGYLLNARVRRVSSRSDLSEEQATRIAVEEVRAYRRERDASS
jgi:hypothetical protein